jgi:hypothetical protein
MFDKLKQGLSGVKDKADSGAVQKAVSQMAPQIQPHLEALGKLDAATVRSDDKYRTLFVSPALLAVNAASSGVTSLIPGFEGRFTRAMFHVRQELVAINDQAGTVALAADFAQRLPKVLLDGFMLA